MRSTDKRFLHLFVKTQQTDDKISASPSLWRRRVLGLLVIAWLSVIIPPTFTFAPSHATVPPLPPSYCNNLTLGKGLKVVTVDVNWTISPSGQREVAEAIIRKGAILDPPVATNNPQRKDLNARIVVTPTHKPPPENCGLAPGEPSSLLTVARLTIDGKYELDLGTALFPYTRVDIGLTFPGTAELRNFKDFPGNLGIFPDAPGQPKKGSFAVTRDVVLGAGSYDINGFLHAESRLGICLFDCTVRAKVDGTFTASIK